MNKFSHRFSLKAFKCPIKSISNQQIIKYSSRSRKWSSPNQYSCTVQHNPLSKDTITESENLQIHNIVYTSMWDFT